MSEFENGEPLDPAQELEARLLKRNEVMHAATKPGNSDIQKFYKGATVFVTGGSGYLGKQLIEKLFRCVLRNIFSSWLTSFILRESHASSRMGLLDRSDRRPHGNPV